LKEFSRLDQAKLVKFAEWRGQQNWSLWEYLMVHGNMDLAVAFSELFWPVVIQVENCYLRANVYTPEAFQKLLAEFRGESKRVEAFANHLHLYDLFFNSGYLSDDDVYEYLGSMLKKSWMSALKEQFPGTKFNVIFSSEPDDYGPTITFHHLTS
jgi:hypothetical protein